MVETKPGRLRPGLSFLGTLAFVGGFFGARIFHLVFPSVMVISQGVHFHHFWYGLILIGVSGWVGIVYNDERIGRICAIVFGVGAGFIGDEVGLLLTFGDYYSELTTDFFVAAISFILLITLFIRYRKQVEFEVLRGGTPERLTQVGYFLVGFSILAFAFGVLELGIPLVVAGILLAVLGRRRALENRARSEGS
jgi:hypothetical protein